MHTFHSVKADSFDHSPFRLIGKEWMLITAGKNEKVNSMTASWGGLGVIWGQNVAYIVVRKSRFTKEFIDASNSFSLCFFDHNKYGEMLKYMGSKSGRNEDKIKEARLTTRYYNQTPFFDEASTVFICNKLCRQPITPENFTVDGINEKWYPDRDYHDLYIGGIMEILAQ